eukprot:SAG22_NODE_221_length_14781_cov_82.531490_6_plen_87_part_00
MNSGDIIWFPLVLSAETAGHFAECPRYDLLWRAVDRVMCAAGMIAAVRRWFVLYGSESASFRPDQYDTVVWIWAAEVAAPRGLLLR